MPNVAPVLDLNGVEEGLGTSRSYSEGGTAEAIAPDATFEDSDSADLDGGTLTVSFEQNGTVDDVLAILDGGDGAGEIGLSGSDVTFGGVVIGTWSGGTNGTDLVVTFNAAATPAAAQALARAITFANGSDTPSTALRSLSFSIADGDGGVAEAGAVVSVKGDGVVTIEATGNGSDQAAQIKAALADPDVTTVKLAAGSFFVGSVIYVPEGKTLVGAGQAQTTVTYLPSFGPLPPVLIEGGKCYSHEGIAVGANARLADLTIDANKLNNDMGATLRVHGAVGRGDGFLVENVTVKNSTGYAFLANGTLENTVNGTFRNVYAENSNVLFETNHSDGVLFENARGADGDGDIRMEAVFHPLNNSRNITFKDCYYVGINQAINVNSNGGEQSNIVFDNLYAETTSNALAAIIAGAHPNEVFFVNSTVKAAGSNALNASNATVYAEGSRFEGGVIGFAINTGTAYFTNTTATGIAYPGFTGATYGVYATGGGKIIWNGGSVFAEGGPGTTQYLGDVTLSSVWIGPGAPAAILSGTDGNDQIVGGSIDEVIGGKAGDDSIDGGLGVDALYGDAGADRILGGGGNDYAFGGDGDDEVDGQDGDDFVDGGAGRDILHGNTGNDYIIGGVDDDRIFGGDGDDLIGGQDGNDFIDAGAGRDFLYGDGGNDHMVGGADNDDMHGQDGDDLMGGQDGDDYVVGGNGRDTLYGDAGNDHMVGGADDDRIFGQDGSDLIGGSEGSDFINGGNGRDFLFGDAGNDHMVGGADNDDIHGQDGDDLIGGQDGDDFIDGGVGRDRLFGDAGKDLIVGGLDNDIIHGQDGDDVVGGQDGDDYIDGGLGRDSLYGDAGRDHIVGGADNDRIFGQDGDDLIGGQDGDDYIEGGLGRDRLYGDGGNDHMLGGRDGDKIYGQAGDDLIGGQEGDDFIDGGLGRDRLFGDAGADHIIGGAENDSIFGQDGNDLIGGQDGDDYIDGGNGRDILFGDAGNDTIAGGAGADDLYGQAGADRFVFSAIGESIAGGADRLLDFDRAAGDLIDLSAIDANLGTPEEDAFTFVGTSAFTNRAGELRYEVIDNQVHVSGDANGDGVADLTFVVNMTSVVATDFIL